MKYTAPDGAQIVTNDPAKLEAFKAAHSASGAEAKGSFPESLGGGWYQLSNGESVQGKDAAQTAQDQLDA
jgi:hypothetical protein